MTCKSRYIELFLIKEIRVSKLPTKFLYGIPYVHRNMICYFHPSCKCNIKLSFSLSRLLVSYTALALLIWLTYTHVSLRFSLRIQLSLILAFVLSRLIRIELVYPWVGWGIEKNRPLCLPLSLSLSLLVCLPPPLSIRLTLSLSLSIYPSIYLSIYLSLTQAHTHRYLFLRISDTIL